MRRLLTKAKESLSEDGCEKLLGLLRAGDPAGHVATTWQGKELIRSLYDHVNEALALKFITRLGQDFTDAAPPEAMNNLTKRVKRAAFGFRSFRNYRIRVLLYAGKPNWSLLANITPRLNPKSQ